MRKSNLLIWAMAGALPALAATVWTGPGASGPLGADSVMAQTTDSSGAPRGGFFARRQLMEDMRWYAMPMQDQRAVRDREFEAWTQLQSFLKDNAPNRYAILDKQQPEFGSPVRVALLQRWENLMQLRQTQPPLYDLMVQQFQSEDRLIGLAARLRRANKLGLTQLQGQLKDEIRAVAGELVDLNLNQRALQVENTRRLLEQQQADLARDTQNKNQLVEARTRRILQQADTAVRPPADTTTAPPTDNNAATPDNQSN